MKKKHLLLMGMICATATITFNTTLMANPTSGGIPLPNDGRQNIKSLSDARNYRAPKKKQAVPSNSGTENSNKNSKKKKD